MAIFAARGVPIQLQFPAFDVDGITPVSGLLDHDFGRYLAVNDILSTQVAVVTEISSGRYCVEFTPNADGLWYVEITTPAEDVFAFQAQVGEEPADTGIKVSEIHRILGLDADAPLCVSKSGQQAGDIELVQTEVANTVRVQRQE